MLGNMIFITPEVNEKLGTKKFLDKIKILKDHNIPMDTTLFNLKELTDDAIEARTSELAKLTYNKLLKF